MRKIPAIISDIDGVLLRSKNVIKGSDKALKFLRQPLHNIIPEVQYFNNKYTNRINHHHQITDPHPHLNQYQKLPFFCLTNGGSCLEEKKAQQLNEYLGLNNNRCSTTGQVLYDKLYKDDVILCLYTAEVLVNQLNKNQKIYKQIINLGKSSRSTIKTSKYYLLDQENLMPLPNRWESKKYMTIEEYASLYPDLVSAFGRERNNTFQLRNEIQQRFNFRNNYYLTYPLQMNAVFILNDPIFWEDCFQVICSLCSSEEGRVLSRKQSFQKHHIPIYTTNNDLTFSSEFPIERFAYGPFTLLFRQIFQQIYEDKPQIEEYGKPTQNTYNFTENYVKNKTPYEISNFYMIGDNPKSDIRGARQQGWTSILVRSGVFNGEINENDPQDPADYVVDNFYEAIKLICEMEKIQFNTSHLE